MDFGASCGQVARLTEANDTAQAALHQAACKELEMNKQMQSLFEQLEQPRVGRNRDRGQDICVRCLKLEGEVCAFATYLPDTPKAGARSQYTDHLLS